MSESLDVKIVVMDEVVICGRMDHGKDECLTLMFKTRQHVETSSQWSSVHRKQFKAPNQTVVNINFCLVLGTYNR